MTDRETLERAVQKAIDGGWRYEGLTDEGKIHYTDTGVIVDWLRGGGTAFDAYRIIFDHDFAKALWGEDIDLGEATVYDVCEMETIDYWPAWQLHLRNMVIANDPIEYIRENMPEA